MRHRAGRPGRRSPAPAGCGPGASAKRCSRSIVSKDAEARRVTDAPSSTAPSREPSAASPGRYLPVRKPDASGKYGTNPTPSSRQAGQQIALRLPREQRVLVLHGGDLGGGGRLRQLVGGHVRHADRPHLAGHHQLGHRTDGVGDRRDVVREVVVEQVDVVGLQPLQRRFDAPERRTQARRPPRRRPSRRRTWWPAPRGRDGPVAARPADARCRRGCRRCRRCRRG